MAKISTLPAAAIPNGTETIPIIQDGATRKATVDQIRQPLQDQIDVMASAQPGGLVGFTTEAAMNAAVTYPPGTLAEVTGVGMFRKTGAVGVAGWTAFVSPTAAAIAADRVLAQQAVTAAQGYALSPDYAIERERLREKFAGTGETAVWVMGSGNAGFGTFGDGNVGSVSSEAVDRFSQYAGPPVIFMAKKTRRGDWLAAVYAWNVDPYGFDGQHYRCGQAYFRPGKRLKYTHAAFTDGDGGAVAYPMVQATGYIDADLSALGPINYLALTLGYTSNGQVIAKVGLTDTDAVQVVPTTLVPTAQQYVTRKQWLPAVLAANGGPLAPGDTCISGTINDSQFIRGSCVDVPVWADAKARRLKMRAAWTSARGSVQGNPAPATNFYQYGVAYCADGMNFNDPGVEPIRTDYAFSSNDLSGNDDWTAGGRLESAAAGDAVGNMGGSHHYARQLSLELTLDRKPIYLFARSVTFSRTGGINRATFATPHGIGNSAAKKVTFWGFPSLKSDATLNPMGGANRTVTEAQCTVIDPYTVEWPSQSVGTALSVALYDPDVAPVALVGGWVKRHEVVTAAPGQRIRMKRRADVHAKPNFTGVVALEVRQIDTLTPAGIEDIVEFKAVAAFNMQGGFNAALSTFSSGNRAAYGPDYQGDDTRVRPIGGSQVWAFNTAQPVAPDLWVNHYLGKVGGLVLWHGETGKAKAFGLDRPALDTLLWSPAWSMFVQERAAQDINGQFRTGVLKPYFPTVPQFGNLTLAGGKSLRLGRFDYFEPFDPELVDAELGVAG